MFVLIALGAWQVGSTFDLSSHQIRIHDAEQCTALLISDPTFAIILQAEISD